MGGWSGGWLRITLIIRLSQPSLAGVGAGAELGNISKKFFNYLQNVINIQSLELLLLILYNCFHI